MNDAAGLPIRVQGEIVDYKGHKLYFDPNNGQMWRNRNANIVKPMFAETFDRLHFVAENGGQVVSYGKLLCQEFMALNDVENLLSYFNYDLLDRPTIFNGAQGSYMLKGSRVNFAEMITEEEQAAMEASIQRLNGLEDLDDDFIKITMLLSPEEANRVSQAFNRDLMAI